MKQFWILIFAVVLMTPQLHSQFDDEGSSSEDSEVEDSPAPAMSVSDSDYKRLAEAIEEKNEDVVVNAASNILTKNPNDLKALNGLAVHYIQTDRLGLAKTILERALKIDPKNPALYNNKAVVRLKEGDMRGAIAEFRSALSESSRHQLAGTNLGSIFLEYRDYQRALVPLKDGYNELKGGLRKGEPQAVQVANNYALALMGSGEPGKAEDVFEDILDTETRNNDVMLNYTILLVDVLKKPSKAKEALGRLKFVSEDPQMLKRVTELEKRAQGLEEKSEKDE